jgi:membrane associated rhomboid family serine protease
MLTGTPIQLKPSFNPMIGPSPYLYINMGARYQPCMHNMDGVQNAKTLPLYWPCPNTTSTDEADNKCTLSELCGFGGVPDVHFDLADGEKLPNNPAPNQWWRFIVPIFLHGGIIHIAFNLLLQLTLGRDVEKLIGSIRFFIVYMAAGIFGFVLGGNFAATGIASTGASGSLFGILAITLLDLLYNWSTRPSPGKELAFICIDIVIAFILGLLPGLDNFSHIGGFLMGLVLGVCILRSPSAVSRRTSTDFTSRSKYDADAGVRGFIKQPLAFFQNRRGVWWAWWLLRGAALLGALIGFVLLLRNFYEWRTGCSWCKHLSCLPIKTGGSDWCSIGNLQFTTNA